MVTVIKGLEYRCLRGVQEYKVRSRGTDKVSMVSLWPWQWWRSVGYLVWVTVLYGKVDIEGITLFSLVLLEESVTETSGVVGNDRDTCRCHNWWLLRTVETVVVGDDCLDHGLDDVVSVVYQTIRYLSFQKGVTLIGYSKRLHWQGGLRVHSCIRCSLYFSFFFFVCVVVVFSCY